jgi:hypothetical protein
MKLSRFDRVLGLNRERIERIYRGERLLNHTDAEQQGLAGFLCEQLGRPGSPSV